MRTSSRVGLAVGCLWLAGCVHPAPKPDSPDGPSGRFIGASLTKPGAVEHSTPPEVDYLLAGRVYEKALGRPVSNASIQVIDLEDPTPAAPLDMNTNNDGLFFIPGLQHGHHYQLKTRVKDGDRLLSAITVTTPPNARMSIYLSEDLTSPTTPAPLGPPTLPVKPTDKASGPPSAALDPPTNIKPDFPVNPAPPAAAAPAAPLNKIAREGGAESGGFEKIPTPVPPSPDVTLPWKAPGGTVLPPPPPITPSPAPVAPAPPAMPSAEQSSHEGLPQRLAPPFCVLVGKRLDDFALNGLDGKTWEFRRDPPRRLVLVEFWKTSDPACQSAVRPLRELQEKYRTDGLEVVGIAYEDPAPLAEQVANVRTARGWSKINYTLLLGGDSAAGPCPVRSQFLVDAANLPQLVLIDHTGEILWRNPGALGDPQYKELEREVDRALHPPSR